MGRWNENNAVAPKNRSSEKLHQNKLLAGGSLWHTVLCQRNYWLYWFYLLQKCVCVLPWCYSVQLLPAMFLLVSFSYLFALLSFHLSGVKDCPHQKAAKKKKKISQKHPKPTNRQTAKPPHHVSEANIAIIHEHNNRNKQNWNRNKHSTTREPTIGTKMKGRTNEKSRERKRNGEEGAPPACTANHSWS